MVNVSQKTILLVEDEMIIATIEMAQLQKEGYKVIHTPTGEEAIEMVKFSPIDLILMDIDLGSGIDGTQTAEEILKSYDIPIVFLSSRTEKEIVQKTEKITSYGYVVKNSGIIVIDASIKMAFKLHEANKNIKKEKEQLRTILQSIGDAVIATDKNGVILQMNTIAEILTGWSVSEARGRHLSEIFKIYNKFTKEPHPDPVSNALTENN
ncbi:MAG TPA: response regulator, partial [Leptospiraceae bacterium]|nr:response regulator [Leptospiraceae bacterium]